MKKLILLLFGLSAAQLQAQQQITYDYAAQRFDIAIPKGYITVPYKGFVDLYLINADTSTYEIEVNKKAVTYAYPEEENKEGFLPERKDVVLYYRINNIESDELLVTISTENKKSKQKLPDISFTIRTFGQWKLNVSTGAIFNIGLNDGNYEINDNTIINAGNENQLVPLFPTVLTHAYRKSASQFNWGASFGFGISDGDNVSFYAGPGFLFGENQRFALSGGLALRKVTSLKKQYQVGQSFTEDTPDVGQLTSEPYKIGGFFAITYNLTSKSD